MFTEDKQPRWCTGIHYSKNKRSDSLIINGKPIAFKKKKQKQQIVISNVEQIHVT